MHQFEDRCHNSHIAISMRILCQSLYFVAQMFFFLVFYQTLLSQEMDNIAVQLVRFNDPHAKKRTVKVWEQTMKGAVDQVYITLF